MKKRQKTRMSIGKYTKSLKTVEERVRAQMESNAECVAQMSQRRRRTFPRPEEYQWDQPKKKKKNMKPHTYHTEKGANIVSEVGEGTDHISGAHMRKENYRRWSG